jgi:hypothetical protein
MALESDERKPKTADMVREKLGRRFSETDWHAAKEEARRAMIAAAKAQKTISYSDLVRKIRRIVFDPHDDLLDQLLDEISAEEDKAGRGMLTAVVVHKTRDKQPGPGFYELAETLGRDTRDPLQCWLTELKAVHAFWSAAP